MPVPLALSLSVDLAFELDRPGEEAVRGQLTSHGHRLDLEVSDPAAFAGSGDAQSIKAVAETLAAQGLVVRVLHEGQHIVSLGAVVAPWWQRRVTGSRRIRLASLRGAWSSARARARGTPSVLPAAAMLPPLTLFPVAPTLMHRPRRRVGTTHDPGHGGDPRLVRVVESPGSEKAPTYWLHRDSMSIGSDPACDVVLPGLEPVHARVRHDDRDEWLIDAVAGVTRVHGGPITSQLLRTGSMIRLGDHVLAFYREEYADHGRPYGGRIGGELGRNTPQPQRAPRPEDGPPLGVDGRVEP